MAVDTLFQTLRTARAGDSKTKSFHAAVHVHNRTGLHVKGHISSRFMKHQVVIRCAREIQSGRYSLIRLIPVLGYLSAFSGILFSQHLPVFTFSAFFIISIHLFRYVRVVSIDFRKCFGIINNFFLKIEMFYRK